MLDKKSLAVLEAFEKNTIEIEAMPFEENSYHYPVQINSEDILPKLDNVRIER